MSLLIIDHDKCKQDGLCAADCPTSVISFKGKGHYPQLVPNGETMCLRCGHCVAICPHGALDHAEVPQAECPPIDKALAISDAQAEQFLRSRRSIRQFKDRPVEKEIIQKLIEVARYAPTGSNVQLVQWVVINDKDRMHALGETVIDWMRAILAKDPQPAAMPYLPMLVAAWDAGVDAVLRNAPCLIVAMAPEDNRNGMVDLSLALDHLSLAAPLYGLGTCWAGLLQSAMMFNPQLKDAVGVPQDFPHHYPMMVGYGKARYFRLPARKAPKIRWT